MTRAVVPAQRAALIWFAEHGPVGWFGKDAPHHRMRLILERKKWIRRIKPPKDFMVIKFELTEIGRKAMLR